MHVNMDELTLALAELRIARDRVCRQLPEHNVLDTPDQTRMLPALQDVFMRLSRAAFDLRSICEAQMPVAATMVVDIMPERSR